MALASYDGSVGFRDLAIGTVLTELPASRRFHEGGGTLNLSAADGSTAGGHTGDKKKVAVNRIEQAPP
jgi:hypothetical protein